MAAPRQSRTASHVSWSARDLVVDRPLPGDLYLCIRHRLIRFRGKGDQVGRAEYDKFVYDQVECVFVGMADVKVFRDWMEAYAKQEQEETIGKADVESKPIYESTLVVRRSALDLFSAPKSDEAARVAIESSQRMVTEFLKKPYVVENVCHLQRYGRGVIDHSVNVSVLSAYLGMQMGFTSQTILEHLALGGLLHDLGKAFVVGAAGDDKMIDESAPEFKQHPLLGVQTIEGAGTGISDVSNEVRMIIAQHHEFMDGSGYPGGLQGLSIYELSRIVAIANVYDNLVSESKETDLVRRQKDALVRLENEYAGKLDRRKLEKAVKILRKSL
jgi:HD-GYP domain-containing protein (c-di-GMP phosphodiesterase class II)